MSMVSCRVLCSALLLAVAGQLGEGARILGVFPVPSLSHQVVFRALMMELASRGHELVIITPEPIRDPAPANYTQISVSFMYDFFRKQFNFASMRLDSVSQYDVMVALLGAGERLCEMLLDHKPVRELISPNSTQHFDLVFVEWLDMLSMYSFAHRFSAPMIGISSLPPFSIGYSAVGNPINPSYIPEAFLPYSDQMTFFERMDNLIYYMRISYFFYSTLLPRHQAIADRYFGFSVPSLEVLHTNVSMLFVNFEPSFHPPRPEVPAVVHLAGLHIPPPKTLPQDISQFLDSAPRGAVYFSLGSNVRSDSLGDRVCRMFLDAFAELNGYHVLWKWESDSLPAQPANVKIYKWMPQYDILRHPKVKVFITQGGLQSTEEAIHCGVPLIGIPFYADQDYNVKRIVHKGIGLEVDITQISKDTLLEALRTVLEDQSFERNVRQLSALMRDQMNTPLERAVWWTEYVLRHRGAAHLRTAAVDMPWYQYLLLDVLAFLLATTLLALLLLWAVAKFLYRRMALLAAWKLKKN